MLAAIFGLALGVLICVLVLAVVSEGDRRFIANVHTSLPPGTWVNRVVLADSPSRRCALVIDPTGVSIATASPDHPALSLPWAAIASAVQTPVTVRGSMFAKQGLVITTADGRTFAMLLPGTTPVRFPVTLVHEAERRIHTGIRDGSDTVTVAAPSRSPAGPARNLLTIGAGLLAVIAQIVALTYRVTHHQSASLAPQGYRTYGVVAGTTFWLREIDNDMTYRCARPARSAATAGTTDPPWPL